MCLVAFILFKLNVIIINKAKNNLKTISVYNMGGKEWVKGFIQQILN
jgi:hypothetical protein